jgi:aminopeptidase
MEQLLEKYAGVILNTCLKVEKDQPLFISCTTERLDFVRILTKLAYKIGVKDIYYDLQDPILRHEALLNLNLDELKNLHIFNRHAWSEYAKKGAAFVMLVSENPGLMADVNAKLSSDIAMYGLETRKEFDDLRDKSMVPWCIAAVPTESWAKLLFKDSKNPVEDLWNKIFDICQIKEDNVEELWNEKINKLSERAEKLNNCHFKTLKYKNSKGTDFSIELPENHLWGSGKESLQIGKDVLVNFPTEEIFTSPNCETANGIVYSSKPLSYHDVIIDNFSITFKNGRAVDCKAEQGEETLKELINSCKNSDRLGEVALVPYDSPISNSNIIFYETLFDENAACHLALGAAFPDCLKGGPEMSKEELEANKLNDCANHVDFMIGTDDLEIIGTTIDGEEIKIFENGNFTQYFN